MLIGGQDSRDEHIVFQEEGHRYLIDGIPTSCSVTTLVKNYFPKFEGYNIAKRMLSKPNIFDDPEKKEKYYNLVSSFDLRNKDDMEKAIKVVMDQWEANGKDSSDKGTAMHQGIEDYYRNLTPLPEGKEYQMFSDFDRYVRKRSYLPFRSEQILWDKELDLAGSADMLYIKESNLKKTRPHVWLVDWKRSKEIVTENRYSKGFGPMKNRDHCNYQHYSLQLNIYKYLIEKHYNLRVKKMSLVILYPDQENWEEYEVDRMKEINEVVKDRIKQVNKSKIITSEMINKLLVD